MAASIYAQNLVLNLLFRGVGTPPSTWYVALFTGDPAESTDNEVADVTYARQSTSFVAALAGAVRNTAELDFGNITGDWGAVTHFAVFDALTAGNMLAYEAFEETVYAETDVHLKIPAGELEVTLE